MDPQNRKKIIPVILSGGIGSRLWPLSRNDTPKQFHRLCSTTLSLFEETCKRIIDNPLFDAPIIIGNQQHRFLIADHLQQLNITNATIILEPCRRNTAPALALAAAYIQTHYEHASMLVLPSDHIIADNTIFLNAIKNASPLIEQNSLVTFGITPNYGETGYGYIEYGEKIDQTSYHIKQFIEKPSQQNADIYAKSPHYCWNSGIFLFPVPQFIAELHALIPKIIPLAHNALNKAQKDLDFIRIAEEDFTPMPNISIDYALMEHTHCATVIPIDCGWSDAGSWESLSRNTPKDNNNNAQQGTNFLLNSTNCYINSSHGPAIAALGTHDLTVISTKDCVFITPNNNTHPIHQMTEYIQRTHPELTAHHHQTYRPWGYYENINQGDHHKVKRICIKPGGKISLQLHHHRAEHWIIVCGIADIEIDGQSSTLHANQSIYIPSHTPHRLENKQKTDLTLIEVQTGSYLNEDDIVRFDDQYGRE